MELDDQERESRVREELEHGCVEAARQWADSIDESTLRRSMRELIREYESV